MLKRTKTRPAQSLLEGILAIAVIVSATLSSVTLIVTTIFVGQYTADKIQAANFAREGIEVVRAIRDSNWMKRAQNIADGATTVQWDDDGSTVGYVPLLDPNYVAKFDPTSWDWSLVSAGDKKIYSCTGYMSQLVIACAGKVTTKYSRTISITKPSDSFFVISPLTDATYLLVTSTVTWNNRGLKTLAVTERLYDWR